MPCHDSFTLIDRDRNTKTISYKQDPLTIALFFLFLSSYRFHPESAFAKTLGHKNTFTHTFETIGAVPYVPILKRFGASLGSNATEDLVKKGLELDSKLWFWQRTFNVKFWEDASPNTGQRVPALLPEDTASPIRAFPQPEQHQPRGRAKHLMLGGAALAVAGLGAAALTKARFYPGTTYDPSNQSDNRAQHIDLNCNPTGFDIVFVRGAYNRRGRVESELYTAKDMYHEDGTPMSICSQYSTWLHNHRRMDKQALHAMRSDIQLYQSGDTLYFYTK